MLRVFGLAGAQNAKRADVSRLKEGVLVSVTKRKVQNVLGHGSPRQTAEHRKDKVPRGAAAGGTSGTGAAVANIVLIQSVRVDRPAGKHGSALVIVMRAVMVTIMLKRRRKVLG